MPAGVTSAARIYLFPRWSIWCWSGWNGLPRCLGGDANW